MRLCASLFRRRRGPAGLRDLFRFCRNCGLYILCSGLSACMGQGWYHYPQPIGLWGQRHKRYLQKHKREVYTTLLVNGKLNSYLADIDEQATTMMFRSIEQMADKEGITEQLKAADQMAWVGAMNNIRNRATEIVNAELIYL